MRFVEGLTRERVMLAEGAVVERLRRDPAVTLDPYIAHAGFVYEPVAASALAARRKWKVFALGYVVLRAVSVPPSLNWQSGNLCFLLMLLAWVVVAVSFVWWGLVAADRFVLARGR
jgi:hypothetical protein